MGTNTGLTTFGVRLSRAFCIITINFYTIHLSLCSSSTTVNTEVPAAAPAPIDDNDGGGAAGGGDGCCCYYSTELCRNGLFR